MTTAVPRLIHWSESLFLSMIVCLKVRNKRIVPFGPNVPYMFLGQLEGRHVGGGPPSDL